MPPQLRRHGKDLSSAALGAVVGTHGGKLGVGFGHECLQLFFKELVCGLGSSSLNGGSGTGCAVLETAFTRLETSLAILETTLTARRAALGCAAEIAAFPTGHIFTLRLGL